MYLFTNLILQYQLGVITFICKKFHANFRQQKYFMPPKAKGVITLQCTDLYSIIAWQLAHSSWLKLSYMSQNSRLITAFRTDHHKSCGWCYSLCVLPSDPSVTSIQPMLNPKKTASWKKFLMFLFSKYTFSRFTKLLTELSIVLKIKFSTYILAFNSSHTLIPR